jgi:hypothetical protein
MHPEQVHAELNPYIQPVKVERKSRLIRESSDLNGFQVTGDWWAKPTLQALSLQL